MLPPHARGMSALGHKQTFAVQNGMSAYHRCATPKNTKSFNCAIVFYVRACTDQPVCWAWAREK